MQIMIRKEDPVIRENADREAENDQSTKDSDRHNPEDEHVRPSDSIKNANAAGLGAIGRNDQTQTGQDPKQKDDAKKS